jgi:hypothetical protein
MAHRKVFSLETPLFDALLAGPEAKRDVMAAISQGAPPGFTYRWKEQIQTEDTQ